MTIMADPGLPSPPPSLRRAHPLRPGDRIAIVAPSRTADLERVRATSSYLKGRGYEVQVGKHHG